MEVDRYVATGQQKVLVPMRISRVQMLKVLWNLQMVHQVSPPWSFFYVERKIIWFLLVSNLLCERIEPSACDRLIFSFDCAEDGKETTNSEAPENNPQYTTVYVGNLAPEARNFLIYYISSLSLSLSLFNTCTHSDTHIYLPALSHINFCHALDEFFYF